MRPYTCVISKFLKLGGDTKIIQSTIRIAVKSSSQNLEASEGDEKEKLKTIATTIALATLVIVAPILAIAQQASMMFQYLLSIPSLDSRIEQAETNTEIDVKLINQTSQLGMNYVLSLAFARATGDTDSFSEMAAGLNKAMWDIRLQLMYIVPPEEVTLIEEGDLAIESALQQEALLESAPSEPIVNNTALNVTSIDEMADDIQTHLMAAMVKFGQPIEPGQMTLTDHFQHINEQLFAIRDNMTFTVPLEEVEITGGMIETIEELYEQRDEREREREERSED